MLSELTSSLYASIRDPFHPFWILLLFRVYRFYHIIKIREIFLLHHHYERKNTLPLPL